MFGLRLLSFLQSDLDILLLIESQYNSTRLLLNLQKSNRRNCSSVSVVYTQDDMPTLSVANDELDEDADGLSYEVEDSIE